MIFPKKNLDCKEVNQFIPLFLRNKIEGNTLKKFVNHVENCPECKEELSIQFFIHEGLRQLKNDDNYFNLQKKLEDKMVIVRQRIKSRDRANLFMTVVITFTIIAVMIMATLVIKKFFA